MKMDTGKMPEKILDLGRYHLSLVDTLHNYPSVSEKIWNAAGKTLVKYFEEYYANLTRTNRYLYQHVYEFDKAGDNKYKLFKANISSAAGVAKIKYNFIDSKIPNKNGYIFKNKASVIKNSKGDEMPILAADTIVVCNDKVIGKEYLLKNSQANLVVICDECHQQIHKGKTNITGYVMTSKGKKLK